jgi:tRNA-dihydrouridine synthase
LFTEFVSVDALHHATGERRERLLKTFIRAQDVAPLQNAPKEIAQIFGHNPEYFKEAAELIESLGFDGIDINMGCPMHKVEDQGSGAGLIRTPELAKEIVMAVKSVTKLPVSVKTRIGVDKDIAEEWMEHLMEVSPAIISLHGRTLRQLYSGLSDWEAIGRAAKVVHKHGGIIFGNGDVETSEKAKVLSEKYGVDGILIGRAAEGNPGIFVGVEPTVRQRLDWMLEHAKVFEKIFRYSGIPEVQLSSDFQENRKTGKQENDNRWFMPMRKHLAWYCKGFEGAVEMRSSLMLTNNVEEVERIVLDLRF